MGGFACVQRILDLFLFYEMCTVYSRFLRRHLRQEKMIIYFDTKNVPHTRTSFINITLFSLFVDD